jgi:predicted PurR-regulated permease PerM
MTGPNNAGASSKLLTLIAVVVVIACLYFGRQILIPLGLAVVLSFLLAPAVTWLQKCRLRRVPAVLLVLVFAFSIVASVGWMVTVQLMNIVEQIPSYKSNIHEHIQSLRIPGDDGLRNARNTVTELSNELSAASEVKGDRKDGKTSAGRPVPVQLTPPPSSVSQYLRDIIGPLTGVVETAAMVIVFALFMLVKREDLRNRLVRLAGTSQLNTVTQAMDDASRRLSRYLLLQFLVNTTYALIFGFSAYWIGIPHALLWGVLAGLLRFVPYVGTPIAVLFPMAMALAVFPGWHQAALIFGVFVLLEIIVANLVEPWLYGSHIGISPLAILVAAVFWTILWGPVGLILSTPLTVCLILMGRYVPELNFLEVLLSDEDGLVVEAHFYQRLLAQDQAEARNIAETYLNEKTLGDFYDDVVIPPLCLAEQDRHVDALEARTANFIIQCTRELIEELGERFGDKPVLFGSQQESNSEPDRTALSGFSVVCIPAGDEADELAATMMAQLLQRLGCDVRQLPIAPAVQVLDEALQGTPRVAIISALPPFAAGNARALCRGLRLDHPELQVIIGLWNVEGGVAKAQERIGSACTAVVTTSLQQVILLLTQIYRRARTREQAQPHSDSRQETLQPTLHAGPQTVIARRLIDNRSCS